MFIEGPTDDINGSFGAAEKMFIINFTEGKITVNGDNSYHSFFLKKIFIYGKKSISLKMIIKM